VPSLLTVLVFSLETWRSHPTSRNDNAKADIATHVTIIQFFMEVRYAMGWILNMGCYPTSARLPDFPCARTGNRRVWVEHPIARSPCQP
jgi:hypothetical protein